MFKRLPKNQIAFLLVTGILFISSLLFVFNNDSFYEQTIVQVTDAQLINEEHVTDRNGNKDTIYEQELTTRIKNGVHKGETVSFINEYSYTGAYDFEYKVGHKLFVSLEDKNGELSGDIKRDKQLLIIGWVFFFTLLLVGKRQGFFATISLILNVVILSFALDMYVNKGINLILISALLVVIFTILSLLLINGRNEKTYAAIVATVIGTFSSLLITYLAIFITSGKGLYYEEMQFLTRPYELVFFAGLFIGSLGAVMDVAISISAALFEMDDKNKNISFTTLKQSGQAIGRDIMGTMTNILFFAYVSGSIPALLLYLKNQSPLGFTLSIHLTLEVTRALAGGIGIVITIPIGLYTTLFFIKRKRATS